MLNKIKDNRGTALLVSLLVMGVLMTVSLLLSSLILRESRLTIGLIDSGRAFYAAEAGIEQALYELNNSLPGWEDNATYFVDEAKVSVGEYEVSNRCSAFPCFDGDFELSGTDLIKYYGVLDLNESVEIPLFVEGRKVTDFVVEFFATFDPGSDLKINLEGGGLAGWDVLRWKIFGVNMDGGGTTDTISDFTALSMFNEGGESFTTNAKRPTWFGTKKCERFSDRYTNAIACVPYGDPGSVEELDGGQFGQVSSVFVGSCLPTEAREYYENVAGETEVRPCYRISDFLDRHEVNFLSLTNLINPSVLNERTNTDFQKLYYRVELEGETAREFANITARGYSGDSVRTVNVQKKEGSHMPVFNFSLYSTDGN